MSQERSQYVATTEYSVVLSGQRGIKENNANFLISLYKLLNVFLMWGNIF